MTSTSVRRARSLRSTSRRLPVGRALALCALAAAAAGVAPSPADAQGVDLRWKHDAGEELVYRMTVEQETSIPGQGNQTSEQVQTMRWTVDDVLPTGDALVTVTTERMQIEQAGPGGGVNYDSETTPDSASQQAAMFGAIVDMGFTLLIAPDGTVKEVRGLEDMLEQMVAGLPEQARAQGRQAFAQMFGEESIESMMQQSVQSFPPEPVAPGGSWDTSSTLPTPFGEVVSTTTYTLEEVAERDGRRVAVIGADGTVAMGEPAPGFPGTVAIRDASVSGGMEFDLEAGRLLSSTSETSMTIDVSAGGQEMAMSNTARTRLELVEHVPAGR